jgi:NAD(P)-dependent dehydrogenase (short-subunit alcohol dehydrogenase family)
MIVVLGDASDTDATTALASGLVELGETATVRRLGTTALEVASVLAEAEEVSDPVRAVVLASAGRDATLSGAVADLDPQQWRLRVEVPLERTLACFQGTHRHLRAGGGSFVVLVPTLALVGAAGLVPWSVVAEGQRSLAKSAARVWGRDGITVNCVAVAGALLASSAAGAQGARSSDPPSPDRPGQPAAALSKAADLRDVASVVATLVSDRWSAVTGATVSVDGGVWMTP